MNKADKAMCMDMEFYKNKGIAEGKKHRKYREVVQSCILHSRESWSWNKEMVDTLRGRNLDLMSSKRGSGPIRSGKQGRDLLTEVEKTLNFCCCKEFGVTRRRFSTRRGTTYLTK